MILLILTHLKRVLITQMIHNSMLIRMLTNKEES